MKWMILFGALTLSLVGCASVSKQETPPSVTSPAPAQAPNQTTMPPPVANDNSKITCSKGKESRLLEVVKKDKGCSFAYTKLGKESDAATSSHGLKHCQDSLKKVRSKLEKAGFACNI